MSKSRIPLVLTFLTLLGFAVLGSALLSPARARAQQPDDQYSEPAPDALDDFSKTFDPSKSYSRLLVPSVADRLRLTNAQIEEINHLMNDRSKKLGESDRAQWPTIVRESEDALKAVLTAEQDEIFSADKKEKKLALRVSKERWADVLRWTASELGLQLIMDAPPPGTLSYNDRTQYSPKEILEILNQILQPKGYTLIRKGEMLHLVDLRNGLPKDLVPNISTAELADYQPHDYVALTIPIEHRNQSTIQNVIKPFAGPYHKFESLPQQKILITDTVQALRDILPVVMSVNNPTQTPTSPVWTDYPLTKIDPSTVEAHAKRFVPSAKSLLNPTSKTISFYASPQDQSTLAAMISRLDADGGMSEGMTMEVYSLAEITSATQDDMAVYANRLGYPTISLFTASRQMSIADVITEGLKTLVPNATLTLNPLSGQLIVIATKEDHAKIQASVDKLNAPMSREERPVPKVYRFEQGRNPLSPQEINTLQTLTPRGILSYDAQNNTLLVVARENDQSMISEAIAGMNADFLAQDNDHQFKTWCLNPRQIAQFDTLFNAVSSTPEMKGIVPVRDTAARRLSIWGTEKQQEEIQKIVDQVNGSLLNGESAEGNAQTVRPLKVVKGDLNTLSQVLRDSYPSIEVIPDGETKSLILRGSVSDIEKASELLATLSELNEDELTTILIPGVSPISNEILSALRSEEPETKIFYDGTKKELVLIGEPDSIERTRQSLDPILLANTSPQMTTPVKVENGNILSISQMLHSAYPSIQCYPDAASRLIVITGPMEDVQLAQELAVQLSAEDDLATDVLPITTTLADEAISAIRREEPKTAIVVNKEQRQIILIGEPKSVQRTHASLDKLLAQKSAPLTVRPVKIAKGDLSLFIQILKLSYPDLNATRDDENHTLILTGEEAMVQEAEKMLQEIGNAEDSQTATFPIKTSVSREALDALRKQEAGTQIIEDASHHQIIVIGKAESVARVEASLTVLLDAATENLTLETRRIDNGDTNAIAAVVRSSFPNIQVTPEWSNRTLTLSGSKAEVAQAILLVDELSSGSDLQTAILPMTEPIAAEVLNTLRQKEPRTQIIADQAQRKIIIIGETASVERTRKSLEALLASSTSDQNSVVVRVEKGNLSTIVQVLKNSFPAVSVETNDADRSLIITGPEETVVKAKDLVTKISTAEEIKLETLPLTGTIATEALDALRQKEKDVQIILDQIQRRIIVIGEPKAVERTKTNLDSLLAPQEIPVKNESIKLEKGDLYALIQVLRNNYPNMKTIPDRVNNALIVSGIESDVASARALVENLTQSDEIKTKTIPLTGTISSEALDALRSKEPKTQIIIDQAQRQLILMGEPNSVTRIDESIQTLLSSEETRLAARIYTAKYTDTETLAAIVTDLYPAVTVKTDPNQGRLILRGPEEKVVEALETLSATDVKETDTVKRYFKAYDIKSLAGYDNTGAAYTPKTLLEDLKRLVPGARVTYETYRQQVIIWGTDEEQGIIEEAIGNLNKQSSIDERFLRYPIRRANPNFLIRTAKEIFSTMQFSYDRSSNAILVSGSPISLPEVKSLLELLDPEKVTEFDPTVAVYPFDNPPSAEAVSALRQLAPSARIQISRENRQLMVIARPAEQKILEEHIKTIEGMMTTPDPILQFYPYENEPDAKMLASLKKLAPNAQIDNLRQEKKLMVTARPREQEIISKTLGIIASNSEAGDPILKVVRFTTTPDQGIVSALQQFAPDARLTLDQRRKSLMIIARAPDLEKIEEQLPQLTDLLEQQQLKMIPYPAVKMTPTQMRDTLKRVYPSIQIEVDEASKRLLIWGTVEEHTRLAEEIAQINQEDGGEYDGPKPEVFTVPGYQLASRLQQLILKMFPGAEVFTEMNYRAEQQKMTVFASEAELKQIRDLCEQLRRPASDQLMKLITIPFNDLDPATVEVTIRNLLPSAMSVTPNALLSAAGLPVMPRNSSTSKRPFFRVDPASRTVVIFAEAVDLETVQNALKTLEGVEKEGAKSSSLFFSFDSPIVGQVIDPIKRLAPNIIITYPSSYELILVGSESDLKKAKEFLDELTASEDTQLSRHVKSYHIPEGSRYSRDAIVWQVNLNFSGQQGRAYAGVGSDWVLLYGNNHTIEKMIEYVDALCAEQQGDEYRTYTVRNIPLATATQMLGTLCPNAQIVPNSANKTLTVYAMPYTHQMIEETLERIDTVRSGKDEILVRYFDIGQIPGASYYPTSLALQQYISVQIPEAILLNDPAQKLFTIIGTAEDQEKVSRYFEELKNTRAEGANQMKIYYLESSNTSQILSVLHTVIPTAIIFNGKRPNELAVWANPYDHQKLEETLAQLESAQQNPTAGIVPKHYKLTAPISSTISAQLKNNLPGIQISVISSDRLLIWANNAEHKEVEKILGVFAEAYPEMKLARYQLKHLRMNDIITFLMNKYSADAFLYASSEGDLMVRAPEKIQLQIAEEIQKIDIPKDTETEEIPQAYDVSMIPPASISQVMPNILRVVPEAIFLPTITPGYFVIYAKPEAQKKIAGLIEQMTMEQPWQKTSTQSYILRNTTYSATLAMLRAVAPSATFTPGLENNQFFATARAHEQEQIANAVARLNEAQLDGAVTKVYHLNLADLNRVVTTIKTLYPTAVIPLVDNMARTITIHATDAYQKKITELFAELDRADRASQPQVATVYLSGIDPQSIINPLKTFFGSDPSFKTSFDANYRTLTINGSSQQIDFAHRLIEQIHAGGLNDPQLTFKTYTLRNPWAYYTIRTVFSRQGRNPYMFQDYSTGKLLVMARPDEHTVINNVLDALEPEKTELAIFDLVELDPQTAYTIISSMLESDGSFIDIQYDESRNRLYIRASVKKLDEIRRFLIQAGETSLSEQPPFDKSNGEQPVSPTPSESAIQVESSNEGKIRTLSGENLQESLDAIQKEWNLPNPIRVIQQSEPLIQKKNLDIMQLLHPSTLLNGMVQAPEQPKSETNSVAKDAPVVYAVVNQDGSVTITSTDSDALDQLQKELEERGKKPLPETEAQKVPETQVATDTSSQTDRVSFSSKNIQTLIKEQDSAAKDKLIMEDQSFSVYKVDQISVDIMISRLTYYMADRINPPKSSVVPRTGTNNISIRTIGSGPRLAFTPDYVLNTIMVKGNKADREEAGAMIALLDRPELFPQPITKPYKIPVRNTSVQKMASQVLNAFQQKFISMKLPGNLMPRISPNTETGNLEVYAPEGLAKEIEEYVRETDEEVLSDPNKKQVEIVRLQQINSSVLQKYINRLTATQMQYNYNTPYMFNPARYYQQIPRNF